MKNRQLNHFQYVKKEVKFPFCILANNMDLTTNIGSFFRIADALGVEKIYLCGKSAFPPHHKIKRTSRSTENYVEWEYRESATDIILNLKSSGYRIIGLEITENSLDLSELVVKPLDKICLILGSEIEGINDELIALSDECVHIPMFGKNSSMNVANACSIAAYVITKKLNPLE